jgi:hypothetical protein
VITTIACLFEQGYRHSPIRPAGMMTAVAGRHGAHRFREPFMPRSTTSTAQIRAILLAIALGLTFAAFGARTAEATPVAEAARSCDVPERSLDEVTALLATPAAPAPEWSGVLPMGEPLRPDEQIQLEATVDQFIACGNAGEPLRIFGLYTDRYLLRLLNGERSPLDAGWHDALATPAPAAPGSGAELVEITGGRRMADGRLGALVTIAFPATPQSRTFFFAFLPQGDHVLIDDIGEILSPSP